MKKDHAVLSRSATYKTTMGHLAKSRLAAFGRSTRSEAAGNRFAKKLVCTLTILSMAIMPIGCGDGGSGSGTKPAGNTGSNSVQNVLDQQMNSQENVTASANASSAPSSEAQKPAALPANSAYDVDLTSLSSTMIYSEVINMMNEPDNYIGKEIRMNGQFAIYQAFDENQQPIPDQIYFACVIADATACCSQGLEFVLAGDYTYPNDYPELGSEITVSGTFETYDEDGALYCHLVNAVFE